MLAHEGLDPAGGVHGVGDRQQVGPVEIGSLLHPAQRMANVANPPEGEAAGDPDQLIRLGGEPQGMRNPFEVRVKLDGLTAVLADHGGRLGDQSLDDLGPFQDVERL
ncbi:hypothetical protein D3C72_2060520 [compost metagenome]